MLRETLPYSFRTDTDGCVQDRVPLVRPALMISNVRCVRVFFAREEREGGVGVGSEIGQAKRGEKKNYLASNSVL